MASKLAVIHALGCILNKNAGCIGDSCPYFAGKRSCFEASLEDAIHTLRSNPQTEKKYRKMYEKGLDNGEA